MRGSRCVSIGWRLLSRWWWTLRGYDAKKGDKSETGEHTTIIKLDMSYTASMCSGRRLPDLRGIGVWLSMSNIGAATLTRRHMLFKRSKP